MGVLQRFERRVERLVNGAFARAFKAEVQPIEIASALQRECDNSAAIVTRSRTMVPNAFVVELSPTDHGRLGGYSRALADELAGVVRKHAAEQRYSFVGPVEVAFEQVNDLETGVFRVRSAARADAVAVGGAQQRTAPAPPAYLEVNGKRFPLAGRSTVLGRGADVDVRIEDPGVSRRHAEFRVQGGTVEVVDLGSTNGIVIDGSRVERAAVDDGSQVVLGSTTVVVHTGVGSG